MCNAKNHSPGCTCGWGGDGHLGRHTGGSTTGFVTGSSRAYSWVPPISQSWDSYVVPNAACPVCGKAVFFYHSPYGGRVFFDELGPPWPKHRCTDRTSAPKALLATPSPVIPKWLSNGWKPFFLSSISRTYKFVLEITGNLVEGNNSLNTTPMTLYIRQDERTELEKNPKDALAFLMLKKDGTLEISLISPSGKQITSQAYSKAILAGKAIISGTGKAIISSASTHVRIKKKILSNQNTLLPKKIALTRHSALGNKSKGSNEAKSKKFFMGSENINQPQHSTAIALAFAKVNKPNNDPVPEKGKEKLREYLSPEQGTEKSAKNITLTRRETTKIKKADSSGRVRTIQVEVRKSRVEETIVPKLEQIPSGESVAAKQAKASERTAHKGVATSKDRLTQAQLEFLKHNGIPLSRVFDATGLSTGAYKVRMKALELWVAYGVSPCSAAAHTLRTRAGHCVQCNPANLSYLRRHDEPGQVYVAESSAVGRLVKVGTSACAKDRIGQLNIYEYGGRSDWECQFVVSVAKAGRVESIVQQKLERYSAKGTYYKNGNYIECRELFSCAKEEVITIVQEVLKTL